ncbi:dynein heavy chain, putative [Plasmodium malariae]|uniref:Dynein heavy chain, putative n=1 Tax=Plasmodium malariae TaxID=5858 RepID=A0A1C3KA23_PLAMA|nr:dynein heavy chain, putative [Plasmodium malariae]
MELEKTHLINYFLEICPTVLDCSRKELQSVLAKKEEEKIRRCVSDKNENLIVLGKESKEEIENEELEKTSKIGNDHEEEEDTKLNIENVSSYMLFVELNINYKCVTKSVAIAFMKRNKETFFALNDKIDKDNKRNLSNKLLMFVCGQNDCNTPLDLVYIYLSQGFNTIFDAASYASQDTALSDFPQSGYSKKDLEYNTSSGAISSTAGIIGGNKYVGYEGESKISNILMTNVSKKLNELLISMKNAQIDLNIPFINICVDRRIKKLVEENPNIEELKGEKLKVLCESHEFLNQLQKDVTKWVEEIQKLTRLNGEFKSGSALAEINFWIGYENALSQLEKQLKTPEVLLTLHILKNAKRYFATMSFDSDIQLKQSKEYVLNVNILMRDFPIDDLLGAQSVQQIIQAIRNIFNHLKKLKNTTKYPLSRSYNFVESLSRDVATSINNVLSLLSLLGMDYQEFDVLISGCMEVFRLWNDEIRIFKDMVRELIKKRSFNERAPAKMSFEHINLQERLDEIHKDISTAYSVFVPLDALDLSKTGEDLWEKAKLSYESKINRVESQITFKLRDQLGGAKTSTEMFNAFSKFNPLFFRPKIRGAIQEYQNSLIQIVVDDLRKLQMIYINGYIKSDSEKVSTIRDIPLVAGSIIWAKQIERKLEDSVKRIENVLGRGWEQHSEGKNLRQSIDNFKNLLSQNKTFEKWLKNIKNADKFDMYEKIIKIKKYGINNYEILANYDFQFFNLFKEVRYLQSINLRVPYSLKVKADETKMIYPYALTLQKTFRNYMKICLFMENEAKSAPFNATLSKLVASIHNSVQAKIKEGINLHWDSDILETYVRKLSEIVNTFESMVDEAVRKNNFVLDTLEKIRTCEITTVEENEIKKYIESIQEKADELYLEHYKNVHLWIEELTIILNKILTERLEEIIKTWIHEFITWPTNNKEKKFILKESIHEFKIINQKFYLHPSVDSMRQIWYSKLSESINIICGITRVKSIYQKKDKTKETMQVKNEKENTIINDVILDNTYRHIMYFIDKKIYENAITCINDTVDRARKYESIWLQYRTLWKIEIEDIITTFGEDIQTWKTFMNEIKETENAFDTLDTEKNFGPIVIDYRILQSKVSSKFEIWQKEIVSEFSKKLLEKIILLKEEVEKALNELNNQSELTNDSEITAMHILSMTPTDIIAIINSNDIDILSRICNSIYNFVEKINEINKKELEWDNKCNILKQSEELLEKQRYAFPTNWLYIDNIIGKLETVKQLSSYQIKLVRDYFPYIQGLVLEYDTKVQIKIYYNKLTLGNLWSLNLSIHESSLREILNQSQGEMALEEFLRGLKDTWNEYELELVQYQNKCKLIKGWNDIFSTIDDHLNALQSMKISPYVKIFEEETLTWDDKLNRLRNVLDVWMNVQRKWVYLEGVLKGSSDIKSLLPQEYNRFKVIDTDFTNIMKKTSEKPKLLVQILWTSNIENDLQNSLRKDGSINEKNIFEKSEKICVSLLEFLAVNVVKQRDHRTRQKIVQMITELVHQRDVIRILIKKNVKNVSDFSWLQFMRFYWDPNKTKSNVNLIIKMADATFEYGYEYLGMCEKLVQTKLTDACFLTLTQALKMKLGGNPFGPAGTGKTESVKALGAQLGRYVLVFNCDESFDFTAMGRIFVGLCQVGAWGCFDEFNRLEERILSAVSEQILTIQTSLAQRKNEIEILNKKIGLNKNVGIFVTMNPGYAGRSNLPDNLKQLFRSFAMIEPDKQLIVQVTLFSQGFISAEHLSSKIVSLFDLCSEQLSKQPHYDFGLRSLKSVLNSAGNLKRLALLENTQNGPSIGSGLCDNDRDERNGGKKDVTKGSAGENIGDNAGKGEDVDISSDSKVHTSIESIIAMEQTLLLKSVCDTVYPKLVSSDILLIKSLLSGVFPNVNIGVFEERTLLNEIHRICKLRFYTPEERWVTKICQIYQIMKLQHGIMLVGDVGTGKSSAWKTLLDSLEALDNIKGVSYIIDAKSLDKEEIYGKLDNINLEWTDGVFTATLRKIIYNSAEVGNICKRHWIIFDGDVDPEWAENLNSVLDDNKLLTLPNGERLPIPENVKIIFEVDTLKHATLATVSRCGMIWFSRDMLSPILLFKHRLYKLKYGNNKHYSHKMDRFKSFLITSNNDNLDLEDSSTHINDSIIHPTSKSSLSSNEYYKNSETIMDSIRKNSRIFFDDDNEDDLNSCKLKSIAYRAIDLLSEYFEENEFVHQCLLYAKNFEHVMDYEYIRVIESTCLLLQKGINNLVVKYGKFNNTLADNDIEKYISKWLVVSILWGIGGSLNLESREKFSMYVQSICSISLPADLLTKNGINDMDSSNVPKTLLDFEPSIEDGEWCNWKERVEMIDVDRTEVSDATLVIETMDTIRHATILEGWLNLKKPFILCGPPGSGKTMTLTSVLKKSSEYDIAALNFSSGSLPNLLLQTFDHYCEYVKTKSELVLRPLQPGKWLIIFADEINLPTPDKYDTQRIIMFMRQIYESQGFWKYDANNNHWNWVKIERITFAGACNPPTDAGRNPLSNRFLRHTAVLYVDFPGYESLKQIYGTFNRAILRKFPESYHMADNLTLAMVDFYIKFSETFTVDMQPHYIYSPRELTRWKLALYETLEKCDKLEKRDLIRLCICEGLRIFQDRLIYKKEKKQTDRIIDDIFKYCFPGITDSDLDRPILYSSYVQNKYMEIDKKELKELIQGKLKIFNEEEINVQLVLFDDVLDHIIRIDRVLRLPLGHLLLVGASGAGKTILSRFVSWINGLSVFQIRAGKNYCTETFEADLRNVMKRAGIKEEKITFIFDESNVLGPAFLERMNALLASGEVPGLFEGDNYTALINECKNAYGSNVGLDESDIFKKFTKQVQQNLHIVFTMNPANPDFANRQATSPALFNRCVIDWFGDWPYGALLQVASEFIFNLDLPDKNFHMAYIEDVALKGKIKYKDNKSYFLSKAIVEIHNSVVRVNNILMKKGNKYNYMTPRDFLDFIKHFLKIIDEKKEEVHGQKMHLNSGLNKLKDTEVQVAELRNSLAIKKKTLAEKDIEAEEKMKLMIEQQAETEDKKKKAEILAKKLDEQFIIIEQRKEIVRKELSEVEPKFREAEEAVKNIPKKNFDELRAMANPPILVRNAVEAVAILIMNEGDKSVTWEDARKIMKGQDFINKVLYLDKKTVKSQTSAQIKKRINNSDWDVERINKASRAAGPLAKWVESVITFLNILETVQPLENEIEKLQEETKIAGDQYNEQKDIISELEKKLVQYKNDYAQLISQVQNIKQEMEIVENKIKRSINLIENLKSEKERWSETFINLEAASETFVGDCLIAAAFCAYIGFFEHYERQKLKKTWGEIIKMHNIKHRYDLSFIEFLSKPSERLQWIANELPSDDLSIENAIIINNYIRYPMIIDPSDQATTFLLNQYADKKIVKTSFSDKNFIKNLETALRFGSTLLVYDVEKIDAILNSVLNQETHKQGGRLLITIGDLEIDFSPVFNLFLTSRDAHFQFTPDLCSRVTFVNFTLTPSSLQNQCLNMILKNERPDIDKKRCDLLKLQGEYKVKIRELEESLLLELSNVKGNILDDDNVISTMEKLKVQAAEASREVNIAEEVMVEIENVSNQYLFLAQGSARIYFILQHLCSINFLYQYDLNFFFNLMKDMLNDEEFLSKVKKTDYEERLKVLEHLLFRLTYNRISRGLLQEDRYVFALHLCYVKSIINPTIYIDIDHLHFLLKDHYSNQKMRQVTMDKKIEKSLLPEYNDEQLSTLNKLIPHKSFTNLKKSIENNKDKWINLLHSTDPECLISSIINDKESALGNDDNDEEEDVSEKGNNKHESGEALHRNIDPHFMSNFQDSNNMLFDIKKNSEKENTISTCLKESLIIKAIRPDKLDKCFNKLINIILGKDFLWIPELSTNDFEKYVKENANGNTPIVLISSPGFDPSNKVHQLSEKCKMSLFSIAMGSEEGYISAEKIISSAQKNGGWVLLKNIHLSPKWLHELEKNIHKATTNNNFRLFLTMEMNPKIPQNLLRISLTFMFEPPVGIKSSMLRTFSLFLENRDTGDPKIARIRLYFIVSFLHAIILERRRYTPIGWTKKYEFSDSDLTCALSVVDSWIDRSATKIGKNVSEHIDPCNIPWDAIKKILNEAIYGGRLDNMVDSKVLDTFINHLMNPNSFEADFKLNICNSLCDKDFLQSPDLFRKLTDYIKWTNNMSNTDLPAWLGFGQQAEGLLTTRTNFSIISKWNILYSKSCADIYEPLPHTSLTKSFDEDANVSVGLYIKSRKKNKKKKEQEVDIELKDETNKGGKGIKFGENILSSDENDGTENENSESSITSKSMNIYSQNENVLLIEQILQSLPEDIPDLQKNEENMSNAVFRCFERENNLFNNLLKIIRGNLNQLKNVLQEKLKYTNKLRTLAKDINSFNVPSSWLLHGNTTNQNLTNWLRELINRLYQIIVITTELNEAKYTNTSDKQNAQQERNMMKSRKSIDLNLQSFHNKNKDTISSHFKLDKKLSINFIWLGGLFYPRAFITATRQLSAYKLKNSLDDLELSVLIGNNATQKFDDTIHFTITCLSTEGAQWSDADKCLLLSDELAVDLPPVTLTWGKKENSKKKINESSNYNFMDLPIYLDKSRNSFIGFWKFPVSKEVSEQNWYQRGVAIFLSKTY